MFELADVDGGGGEGAGGGAAESNTRISAFILATIFFYRVKIRIGAFTQEERAAFELMLMPRVR